MLQALSHYLIDSSIITCSVHVSIPMDAKHTVLSAQWQVHCELLHSFFRFKYWSWVNSGPTSSLMENLGSVISVSGQSLS